MPINEPIPDRKVAPNSLAFDPRGRRGSTAAGNATYQTELSLNVTVNVTNVTQQSTAYIERRTAQLMAAVAAAERRAKVYVGQYNKQFLWTVFQSHDIYIGGVSALPADFENVRIMSANHNDGIGANGEDVWKWYCLPGQEGVYWLYAHYKIAFTEAMAISRARLGIAINGTVWQYVDDLWYSNAGELPILNANLKGGTLVRVRAGDYITFVLNTTSGAPAALAAFSAPTSLEGSLCGFRVQCNNDYNIDDPDQMDSYTVAT